MNRTAGSALAYAEVALGTMVPATAALLYSEFFTTRDYLLPVLAAAGAAAVVATVATVRRWRALTIVIAGVVGFALLATYLVLRPTLQYGLPTLRTATELGTGLLHGWTRMLSVSLPADVTPALLITPVLLAWVSAFLSTVLVLRTRVVLAPVLPALLALAAGLLLTASRPGDNLVMTAAFLLETLLLVLVRVTRIDTAPNATADRPDLVAELEAAAAEPEAAAAGAAEPAGTHPRAAEPELAPSTPGPGRSWLRRAAGRIAFGVPVVLLVALAGVAGARFVPVAPGTDRFDPRDVVPLHYAVNDSLTPLATLKRQLREPSPRRLFTVRVDSGVPASQLDRVRTAALDTFDGALWTSSDSFLVAGHTLAADPTLANARRVGLHVAIDDLDGPYLPVAGWPVLVGASGLGFSDASGVLVSNAASLRGMAYDVVGELRPSDAGIRSATPDAGTDGARYTQLPPGLPPEIQARAAELTAPAAAPYDKLKAIEYYLHNLPYSLDARPGHSYDALRRLFSSNPQDRMGYAEQYASAFAILARSQGFPVRVATGYLLRRERLNGNAYTVTTADAHAWAEVDLVGYGWVKFEPTDFTQTTASLPDQQKAPPGAQNQPPDPSNPGAQAVVDPNLKRGPSTGERVLAGTLIALAVLGGLLVLVPIVVAAEKLRRRQRRHSGPPAMRVVGAWRETTDRLVEHGVGIPRSFTPLEVAVSAEERLGESAGAVAVLAPMVTAAVYAPTAPSDDEVREAWRLNAQLRRDLRRHRGFFPAVRAWFDPRPLVAGWRDARRGRRALQRLRRG